MSYNFLNLPNRIQTQQGNHIDFLYDATGRKWAKKGTGNQTRMYIGNIEYNSLPSRFRIKSYYEELLRRVENSPLKYKM